MSTVEEIEAAIERLPATKVDEIAAWLEEYQRMVHASSEVFGMYDKEEEKCRKQDGEKSG
jgi:hypothetical protein